LIEKQNQVSIMVVVVAVAAATAAAQCKTHKQHVTISKDNLLRRAWLGQGWVRELQGAKQVAPRPMYQWYQQDEQIVGRSLLISNNKQRRIIVHSQSISQ
jgi:hypothetical protein